MLEFLFKWLLKTGLKCVLRYLFRAQKYTSKKACRIHLCQCNLSSPSAQYLNSISSFWAIICHVLLGMKVCYYQPLLET